MSVRCFCSSIFRKDFSKACTLDNGTFFNKPVVLQNKIAIWYSTSNRFTIIEVAAERLFVKEKYKEATASLKNYLVTYCDKQTLNCISAQYYLAESYYKTEQLDKALTSFERLTKLTGNPYQEEALIRRLFQHYESKLLLDKDYQ